MLSYHGNDHYNSVRSIRACPSSSGGMIDDRRGSEGRLRSSKGSSASRSAESGRGDGEDGDADDADKDDAARGSDDGMEGGAKAGARRSDRRIVGGNEGRRRPPARGSACPCGSGKKYKKCCSARDKIETRRRSTTRLLRDGSIAPNEGGNARESYCDKDEEKDGAEEFIGSFKVLAI